MIASEEIIVPHAGQGVSDSSPVFSTSAGFAKDFSIFATVGWGAGWSRTAGAGAGGAGPPPAGGGGGGAGRRTAAGGAGRARQVRRGRIAPVRGAASPAPRASGRPPRFSPSPRQSPPPPGRASSRDRGRPRSEERRGGKECRSRW